MAKKKTLPQNDLKTVPGVSTRMEQHFFRAGIHTIPDLVGRDPEELYRLDCLASGREEDRCVLYVFRLAVYYASTAAPEPEKCNWWYWKDPVPQQDS